MFVNFENYDTKRADIFDDISDLEAIGLDIETTGLNPWSNKPLLLIFKGKTQKWTLDLRTIPKLKIKKLLTYIATKIIVGHNLKFDYKFLLYNYGVEFKRIFCTYVVSRILWTGVKSRDFSLAGLVEYFFQTRLSKDIRESFINKPDDQPFTEAEIEYAENDVEYLLPLREKLSEIVTKYEMNFLADLENRFLLSLVKIELRGVKLDEKRWLENVRKLEKNRLDQIFKLDLELKNLSEKFPTLRNADFDIKLDNERAKIIQTNLFFEDDIIDIETKNRINWSSPPQIKKILYLCNIPLASTGEEALLEFNKSNPNNPLYNLFLLLVGDGHDVNGLRQIEKALSTYGENFFNYINPRTGKIHTNFSQVMTETGRLSSGDISEKGKPLKVCVNLQNIPADNSYRNCFIPDPGYLFCSCDLSSAELRIAASDSQDPLLLANFNEGLDLHSYLAQKSFRIIKNDPEFIVTSKINKDLRTLHKRVIFGYLYGGGPTRISQILNIPIETAGLVYKELQTTLPVLTKYLNQSAKFAVKNYYIKGSSRTNRRRWFEDFFHNKMEAHSVERQAKNAPIQSTNADMIKEAIIEIDDYFESIDNIAFILFTVHDEVDFVIPENRLDIAQKVKEIMEEVGSRYLTGVVMSSDLTIDKFWKK